MNEKYVLERKGENAPFYLCLFLIFICTLVGILVKNEMLLVKKVLEKTSEMKGMSLKLKTTSQEQGSFSKEILSKIQTIHVKSQEILKTANILQENTNSLNTIKDRLNQNTNS